VVLLIGADTQQAKVTKGYIEGILEQSPMLREMVESITQDEIVLRNQITISVRSANYRRLRGVTAVAVIASEVAFWIDAETSANPADEILAAVRPALLTTRGPLVMISSPYSRSGPLFEVWRDFYGKDGPEVLVARAPTRLLNPTIPQDEIDRAMKRDSASARSEFLAEWRDDVAAFINRAAVEACVDSSVLERQPHAYVRRYFAFVDPSGGSADSFTMAIAHGEEGGRVVIDCLREVRPPFNPEAVVEEFCETLRRYRITQVTGDRYAGEWPRSAFRKRGVSYECSELDASALYREVLPRLNTKTIALLDHPRAIGQLAALERRVTRSGKDSIGHSHGAHDDLANVIAGVAWLAGDASKRRGEVRLGVVNPYSGEITWLENGDRPSALKAGPHQTAKASPFWKKWNPARNCFE